MANVTLVSRAKKIKDILLQKRCATALDETGGGKIADSKKVEQTKIAWRTIFLHLFECH